MLGRRETLVGLVGALLVTSTAVAQQPPAATKFVTPLKGEALVEILAPQAKYEGNLLVTKFKMKNVSAGPIAGLKVDEYWYNKKGDTVSGAQTFRVPKPLMPGEIIEVVLRSPKHPEMARNIYMFAHANGKVKPTKVAKFSS
jgi:hypothetical protein